MLSFYVVRHDLPQVTEDFVRYLADQQGGSSVEEQSQTPQTFGPEDVPPYISAEELVGVHQCRCCARPAAHS